MTDMATAKGSTAKTKTVDMTTGIGTLSFPKVFKSTHGTKDDGTPDYNIQIIIPKGQRDDLKKILRAIREVGEDRWGDKWKGVKSPLRDGDKEKDDITDDGSTKGEKYPERLGCYFLNARSGKPVGVVDRNRVPIEEPTDLYGGCKGRLGLNFYAYSNNGNHGIAAGLNGVQKTGEGEPLAAGAPPVESMFDLLDDEDDLGLDDEIDEFEEDEVEEEPAPKRRAPAKKAAAKRKPAPEPEEDEDEDLLDDEEDEDEVEEEPAPRRRAPAKKAPAKKAPARRKAAPVEDDEDDLLEDLDDEDA